MPGFTCTCRLAKEFEDFGDYPKAFDHYLRGKAAHRDRIGPSSARDAAIFDAIRRWFDRPRSDAAGDGSREPIFVMGMPRSGTTLTDRILSAHGDVHSAGELSNFGVVLQRATGKPARSLAETIANLDPAFADWARLGRAYVESTRPGTGHTPHFVDKLPHNFLYAGFIAHALAECQDHLPAPGSDGHLPEQFQAAVRARIAELRLFVRHPRYRRAITCSSTGLMKHWQQLLPGRIMEVEYEAPGRITGGRHPRAARISAACHGTRLACSSKRTRRRSRPPARCRCVPA